MDHEVKKGVKIPQKSSSRHGCALRLPYFRKLLKNGAPKQEAHAPIFVRAHIQLAGGDLPNNHILSSFPAGYGQHFQENYSTPAFSCQSEIFPLKKV